jgi:hypothetical protein
MHREFISSDLDTPEELREFKLQLAAKIKKFDSEIARAKWTFEHIRETREAGLLVPPSDANHQGTMPAGGAASQRLQGGKLNGLGNAVGSPREMGGDCEYHRVKIARLQNELNAMLESNLKIKEQNMKLKVLNQNLSNKIEEKNLAIK